MKTEAQVILDNNSTIMTALGRQLAAAGQMLGAALVTTTTRSEEAIKKIVDTNDEAAITKAVLVDQSCILAAISLMAPSKTDQQLLALMARATAGIAADVIPAASDADATAEEAAA